MENKKLNNGLKINVLKNDNEIIKFSLSIGAGYKHENLENNGIAHYLEHTLILKKLELIYPYLIDFTTSYHSINLFFQCDKARLKELFDLLFELFTYDKFDEKHIKFIQEEKTIIKNDINLYNDQVCTSAQWLYLNKLLFDNSKSLNYLGNPKNIDKLNDKDLIKWKNKYFVVNNTSLNFIGNITIDEVEIIIENTFSKLKKKIFDLENNDFKFKQENIVNKNLLGKYFYYGFDLNKSTNLQIVALILMNKLNSIVRDEVRVKNRDGYFNFVDVNFDLGYLYFHIGSFSMRNKKLLTIVRDKILNIESYNFEINDFEQNKNFVIGYLNNFDEMYLLLNMSNLFFDKNGMNLFTLKDKIEKFTYEDYKKGLNDFFKTKQDYLIVE